MRRSLLVVSVLVASAFAPSALGDDAKGLLVVVAEPAATCEIDGAIRGPSPVLARLAVGEHAVTCRAQLDGVTVARSAKAIVKAGAGTKVALDLKVGP